MTCLQIGFAAMVLSMEKNKISVKKSVKSSFSCERNQGTTAVFSPPQAILCINNDDDTIADGRCLSFLELRQGVS